MDVDVQPCFRRGMFCLDKWDSPEQMIALWSIFGSWHSSDMPLIESAFPWYRVEL